MAELPAHTDQNRPNSCLLIIVSNKHKCPNNLCVFASSLSSCDSFTQWIFIFFFCHFYLFLSLASFPCAFPSWECHLPFLQWIGFQLLSQAWRLLSPGFCHLSQNSLPFSLLITIPPSRSCPPRSLPLSLTRLNCLHVCNPDFLQTNWNVADFKHHGNNFSKNQGSFACLFLPLSFYFSPCFLFSLLRSSLLLFFTSFLPCLPIPPAVHLSRGWVQAAERIAGPM